MKYRNSRAFVFIIVLLLASFSCQLLSSGAATEEPAIPAASATLAVATSPAAETETAETSPVQTADPAATQPESTSPGELPPLPPAQPGPETLDLGRLPKVLPINDYSERLQVVMDFTDPDGVPTQMTTLYDFRQTSVPESAWFTLFEDENPFLSQKYETALVSGQGYTITDTSACQVVTVEVVDSSGQRQPFTDLINALTGQVSLSEADVTVGDQLADAYAFDVSNFVPGSQVEIKVTTSDDSGTSTSTTTIRLSEEDSTLESGKLFLARQGSYLLRLELLYSRVVGEDDAFIAQLGSTMTRSLVYEALPAAAVEPIQPPSGCSATTGAGDDSGGDDSSGDDIGGAGTFTINDLPRLYDETNTVQAGDSLIFQTTQDMQSVLDFYRSELEAAGWEVTDEINLGTLASMELVRGAQTISITLTQSGENLMVTITLE